MNYYNELAKGYNELHGQEQLEKLRTIKEYLEQKKLLRQTDTILDIGCGTGISAEVFDNKIQGIEPAKELAKQANFPVIIEKAENLPFPSKSFDIILCITAIHHFELEKSIAEMKRVGKKLWIITILKKANNAKEIEKELWKQFSVITVLDNGKDNIFILNALKKE